VDAAHTKRTKSLPRYAVFVAAAYPSIFQEDSLKLLCHYLLSSYLQGSLYMQDAVMQLIVTSMLFFLLLLHVQLYNAMPALTLLPLALVVGVVTLYLLMLLVRWLTKHFNEWNARRVAPFAERVVKAEHDEFVGEFETGGDLELDDTDLFEDLSMQRVTNREPPPARR
jgi:prepilin signal peptidase PulO-like enzyme (type II secretory pathway)